MEKTDRSVRRALLKPIARRKPTPATPKLLASALDYLDKRALATALLPDLARVQKEAKEARSKESWKNPDAARISVAFAKALFLARRISSQEYTFFVAVAAEGVHDGRMSESAYPEISELMNRIRAVEVEHNLPDGHYWRLGEGPPEYLQLNTLFDDASQKRFGETLEELGAFDLATLFATDQAEFDRLRERGRRSIFHKDETIAALVDTVVRYEREARLAASTKAYTSAVVLLGAAVEGLLLLRCLRSRRKAQQVAAALPRAKRPRGHQNPCQWTFDTLIETCLAAGWLPDISTESTRVRPHGLAHLLREMRNYVHPGKVATQRPWIEAEAHDFADAEAIYTTLFATISRGKYLKRLREAAESQPALSIEQLME